MYDMIQRQRIVICIRSRIVINKSKAPILVKRTTALMHSMILIEVKTVHIIVGVLYFLSAICRIPKTVYTPTAIIVAKIVKITPKMTITNISKILASSAGSRNRKE